MSATGCAHLSQSADCLPRPSRHDPLAERLGALIGPKSSVVWVERGAELRGYWGLTTT